MSSNITVGIDVGTYEVRVVVAESDQNSPSLPNILGTGKAESKGLRHGYIINTTDVAKSVITAINTAEKTSGQKIKRAFISIGGIGLSGIVSTGSSIVARADQEVTDVDMEQAMNSAEESIPHSSLQNRKIIYNIPMQWKIDGRPVLGKARGLKGIKLEVKALFVTCIESHINDLVEAIETAGIEVVDVVASPIAGSFVTLTKSQKVAGCVLANIGAETVSIVVFENNIPISLEVFPIGGTDITNDIALGLKISLEEAEDIKTGRITSTSYSKRRFEEIVAARLSDIFELIEAHLRKIGKNGLLPAGIIITGGSSGMTQIADLARNVLRLPSKIASISPPGQTPTSKIQMKDSSWSVAYGLCIMGTLPEEEERLGIKKHGSELLKKLYIKIKQFLP